MEILDPSTIAFLLLAGFIAAFIDSTVGGGGLISTPALLALGLPVNFALGTNKLAASMGGLMSVFSFWRAGKINQKVAISLMPLSFLGSALGAYVVYLLPEQLMKNVIVLGSKISKIFPSPITSLKFIFKIKTYATLITGKNHFFLFNHITDSIRMS